MQSSSGHPHCFPMQQALDLYKELCQRKVSLNTTTWKNSELNLRQRHQKGQNIYFTDSQNDSSELNLEWERLIGPIWGQHICAPGETHLLSFSFSESGRVYAYVNLRNLFMRFPKSQSRRWFSEDKPLNPFFFLCRMNQAVTVALPITPKLCLPSFWYELNKLDLTITYSICIRFTFIWFMTSNLLFPQKSFFSSSSSNSFI